jgi:hypothetical protein
MAVEVYRDKDVQVTKDQPAHNTEATLRLQLVEKLGFDPSLQCVKEAGDEIALYPELTGLELEIWSQFHQSYYSRKQEGLADYHFDRVPTDVLTEIDFAVEFGHFDDVEIWTPERDPALDPMAVGVIGHRLGRRELIHSLGKNAAFNLNARFFPIVRWGESLLSITDIKQMVLKRRTETYYAAAVWPDLPQAVRDFVERLFDQSPRESITVTKAGLLYRHCRRRMYDVNGTKVCAVCGAQ